MIQRFALSVLFLAAALSIGATEYLVRLSIPPVPAGGSETQELEPLRNRARVLAELPDGGLILANGEEVVKWEASGAQARLLDQSPGLFEYWMIGLRPDSDLSDLSRAGEILHTEENWVLLRLYPGPNRLREGAFHIAALPREPFRPVAKEGAEAPALHRRPVGPQHAVPLVQQMVSSVNTADIDAYWTAVTVNAPTGNRMSTGTGCTDAANYVLGQFQSLGLAARNITHTSGYAPNTEGQITGAVNPGVIYLVEGHLDDLPNTGSAPGADDNASGSVNVLEAAKILSCYAFKNTVRFLTVTGEEQGLFGSTDYADDAALAGENIQGVINMDMPGWAGDGLPGTGENLDLNYDSNSAALGAFYAQCATDYATGLPVDAFLCPSLTASDHYGFWQNGFKAVCGITDNEGYCGHAGNYPYYHQSTDTIANCGNKTFFYNVAKTTIAALAELGEPFKITLDKTAYACSGPVQIIVGDRDLNTNPSTVQTVVVSISSTYEPAPETVTLTEDGVNSMIFRGTISLSTTAPANGDGFLSVAAGSTITTNYTDAVDCNGAANVGYTASAPACTPPVISNVQITGVTPSSAVVTWTTNVVTNSRVTYDTSTPPGTNLDNLTGYVTSHSMTLSGLTPCTTYFLSVTSADEAGNSATDTNGGGYYSFTTLGANYAFGPDTVESGAGSWVATGTPNAWHIDTCRSATATHAWKAGASDAPTCTAGYAATSDNYLTWNANLVLGAAGHGFHLRFNEWYDTESNAGCTYDPVRPQISTNGGSAWTTLATNCGSSGGWLARDYDLAAYSGSTVRIRFWFHSDGSVFGEGWYVDDIEISKNVACAGCTAPGAPTLSSATGTCAGVNLSWTAGTGTTNSYNVYRSANTACPAGTLTKLNGAPLTSTTYTDTAAVGGTTYTYVVRGACDAGGATESANSNCRAAARLTTPAAPAAGNNGPLCAGATLNLTASTVGGATYAWTGPNGFSSSQQNPSIAGVTTAASGTYSVTATVGGCTSSAGTTNAAVTTCAPNIVYQASGPFTQVTGDGDAYYEPGEKWSVSVTLTNSGTAPATGVTADLSGNGVTVCATPQAFGIIAVGATGTATFEFVISAAFAPCGSAIGFDILNKSCVELTPAGADQLDVFSVTVGQPAPGTPTELVIQPSVADTYINAFATGTPYGGATTMQVNSRSAVRATRSLVQFDLSGIPAGATINSATLELYATLIPSTQVQLDAHRITATWTEAGVTWATAPTFTGTADATNAGTLAVGWKTWTVTPVVQAWFGGSATNNGFLVKANTETTGAANIYQFATKENATAAQWPILRVNYTPASGGWDCSYVGSATCTPCVAPSGLTNNGAADVNVCAAGGVLVTFAADAGAWGDTSGVRTYDILRNGGVLPAGTGLAYPSTSFTDTTGAAGTTYTYSVRYNNGCGLSSTTAGTAAADANGTPGAPAITGAADPDACVLGGVQITYTAGSGATRHDLYKDAALAVTGYASGATYAPGDTVSHNYMVRAVNGSCATDSGAQAAADAANAPPVVMNHRISKSASDMTLTWDLLGMTVDRYEVWRALSPAGPFDVKVGETSGLVDGFMVTLSGQPASAYYLVRAVIGSCNGTLH